MSRLPIPSRSRDGEGRPLFSPRKRGDEGKEPNGLTVMAKCRMGPVFLPLTLNVELDNITVLEHMVSLHHLAIVYILSPYLSILQLFQEILVDFRGKIL